MMSKSTTSQLTLYLGFGAAVLVGGALTVALARLGTLREWGAPEFMIFMRRLGWTAVASGAVWEAIAFMKLLLGLTETTPVSRNAKGKPHEKAGQR